jgi:molecular chaperone HscA
MPYAYDEQRKGIRVSLADMLGSATILSDTLGSDLIAGVDYRIMRAALNAVQEHKAPRWLVMECVGEPVAAGNFAMDEEVEQLTVYMIVDIGAGTTDFSVLCIKKPVSGDVEAIQIANGSLTIELAGNAVDKALVDFLVRQEAGEEHRATLAAAASSMKERLFAPTAAEDERFDQEVTGGMLINVDRQEFLASPEWKAFADSLASAQAACFDKAQRSYLQGYGPSGSPIRVVMTGGGANLPLVEELATGRSKGEVKLVRNYVADFPITIQQRFAEILPDLPRLAVALGGSRPELPAQSDRTDAQPGPKAPIRVQGPADKTATGLGSGDSDSFGG